MAPLRRRLIVSLAAACATLVALPVPAQDRSIVVASTTSTEQSGLFGHLLPAFAKKTGIAVKVVAVGTGQALDIGRRGDADVVFVHDRAAEDKYVAECAGIDRRDVMYNDFVLVGPKSDPAKVAGSKDIAAALKAISDAKAPFVSRGDKSGTHAAELRYFRLANVDPLEGKGSWYRETGSGMGPALNTASSMNAWPRSFFTCACLAGFTRMMPYWLNNRWSPSTEITRSARFLKESQVPRSVSA